MSINYIITKAILVEWIIVTKIAVRDLTKIFAFKNFLICVSKPRYSKTISTIMLARFIAWQGRWLEYFTQALTQSRFLIHN